MPLYKDENSKSNGRKNHRSKKNSQLIQIFKRYNADGISMTGLENFFIYNIYSVGYHVDVTAIAVFKFAQKIVGRIADFVGGLVSKIATFADRLADVILDDLGEPLSVVGRAYNQILEIAKQSKNEKNKNVFSEVGNFVKTGFSKNRNSANTLFNYIMPIISCSLFALIAWHGLSREYAVRVISNGQPIGVVNNYMTLQNADKIIENKLVSTNDQEWNFNPDIKIVSLSRKTDVIDERQLANNILEASSEDIVEATGLYVDGKFIAAVEDAGPLNRAIDELKAPYENGDPNRTVTFVQNVSIVDGIFFADSIKPDMELANIVSSEVSGEKIYTLVAGDSPSLIASKNDLKLAQLYSLNPWLEGAKGLFPGDTVIVSASVPFLQVKYIDRLTREVEIPFTTKEEKNNSMSLNTRKTTQVGENGLKEEVVDVEYIDGVYQGEKVIQTTVVKEPVQQIVQVGTLWNGVVVQGGNGKCMFPVTSGWRISRGFTGQYKYGGHDGLDIAAPYGTPIVAANSGVVTTARYTRTGYGIYCIINHGGYETLYGHCSRLYVSKNQQVSKGQLIAAVGSTGNSTGNHCHFEVKIGNTRYDPWRYM